MFRRGRAALIVVLVLLVGASAAAQRFRGGRGGRFAPVLQRPGVSTFQGAFNFCRVAFRQSPYGDGGGWQVDYPRADVNLSIRLSELSKAAVSMDETGAPRHVVITLAEDELFKCPFIMMTEVGAAFLDEEEAARLGSYLRKGGFLWADDFWGTLAWQNWESEIRKALPAAEYPILDVPLDHALMRTLFELKQVPQIPSIGFWGGLASRTSERGSDSGVVHTRAIHDESGRMMVLMTHNTDFGDAFEREGDDPDYFYAFSVSGYAVGINILLYSMTH
jgi:hypothetical protein